MPHHTAVAAAVVAASPDITTEARLIRACLLVGELLGINASSASGAPLLTPSDIRACEEKSRVVDALLAAAPQAYRNNTSGISTVAASAPSEAKPQPENPSEAENSGGNRGCAPSDPSLEAEYRLLMGPPSSSLSGIAAAAAVVAMPRAGLGHATALLSAAGRGGRGYVEGVQAALSAAGNPPRAVEDLDGDDAESSSSSAPAGHSSIGHQLSTDARAVLSSLMSQLNDLAQAPSSSTPPEAQDDENCNLLYAREGSTRSSLPPSSDCTASSSSGGGSSGLGEVRREAYEAARDAVAAVLQSAAPVSEVAPAVLDTLKRSLRGPIGSSKLLGLALGAVSQLSSAAAASAASDEGEPAPASIAAGEALSIGSEATPNQKSASIAVPDFEVTAVSTAASSASASSNASSAGDVNPLTGKQRGETRAAVKRLASAGLQGLGRFASGLLTGPAQVQDIDDLEAELLSGSGSSSDSTPIEPVGGESVVSDKLAASTAPASIVPVAEPVLQQPASGAATTTSAWATTRSSATSAKGTLSSNPLLPTLPLLFPDPRAASLSIISSDEVDRTKALYTSLLFVDGDSDIEQPPPSSSFALPPACIPSHGSRPLGSRTLALCRLLDISSPAELARVTLAMGRAALRLGDHEAACQLVGQLLTAVAPALGPHSAGLTTNATQLTTAHHAPRASAMARQAVLAATSSEEREEGEIDGRALGLHLTSAQAAAAMPDVLTFAADIVCDASVPSLEARAFLARLVLLHSHGRCDVSKLLQVVLIEGQEATDATREKKGALALLTQGADCEAATAVPSSHLLRLLGSSVTTRGTAGGLSLALLYLLSLPHIAAADEDGASASAAALLPPPAVTAVKAAVEEVLAGFKERQGSSSSSADSNGAALDATDADRLVTLCELGMRVAVILSADGVPADEAGRLDGISSPLESVMQRLSAIPHSPTARLATYFVSLRTRLRHGRALCAAKSLLLRQAAMLSVSSPQLSAVASAVTDVVCTGTAGDHLASPLSYAAAASSFSLDCDEAALSALVACASALGALEDHRQTDGGNDSGDTVTDAVLRLVTYVTPSEQLRQSLWAVAEAAATAISPALQGDSSQAAVSSVLAWQRSRLSAVGLRAAADGSSSDLQQQILVGSVLPHLPGTCHGCLQAVLDAAPVLYDGPLSLVVQTIRPLLSALSAMSGASAANLASARLDVWALCGRPSTCHVPESFAACAIVSRLASAAASCVPPPPSVMIPAVAHLLLPPDAAADESVTAALDQLLRLSPATLLGNDRAPISDLLSSIHSARTAVGAPPVNITAGQLAEVALHKLLGKVASIEASDSDDSDPSVITNAVSSLPPSALERLVLSISCLTRLALGKAVAASDAGKLTHWLPVDTVLTILSSVLAAATQRELQSGDGAMPDVGLQRLISLTRLCLSAEEALQHAATALPEQCSLYQETVTRIGSAIALKGLDEGSIDLPELTRAVFGGALTATLGSLQLTRAVNLLVRDTIASAAAAAAASEGDGGLVSAACDVTAIGLLYTVGVRAKALASSASSTAAAASAVGSGEDAASLPELARSAYSSVTKKLLIDAIRASTGASAASSPDATPLRDCVATMGALLTGLPASAAETIRSDLITLLRKVARNPAMLVAPSLQQPAAAASNSGSPVTPVSEPAVRASSSLLSSLLMAMLLRCGAASEEDAAGVEVQRAVTILRASLPLAQQTSLGTSLPPAAAAAADVSDPSFFAILSPSSLPPPPSVWPWGRLGPDEITPQPQQMTSPQGKSAFIRHLLACDAPASASARGVDVTDGGQGITSAANTVLSWLTSAADSLEADASDAAAAAALLSVPPPDVLAARVVATGRLIALWSPHTPAPSSDAMTPPAEGNESDSLISEVAAVASARHSAATLASLPSSSSLGAGAEAVEVDEALLAPIGLVGHRSSNTRSAAAASNNNALPSEQLTSELMGYLISTIKVAASSTSHAAVAVSAPAGVQLLVCFLLGSAALPLPPSPLSGGAELAHDYCAIASQLHRWLPIAPSLSSAAVAALSSAAAGLMSQLEQQASATNGDEVGLASADADGPLMSAFRFAATSASSAARGGRAKTAAEGAQLLQACRVAIYLSSAATTLSLLLSPATSSSPSAAAASSALLSLVSICSKAAAVLDDQAEAKALSLPLPLVQLMCVAIPLQTAHLLASELTPRQQQQPQSPFVSCLASAAMQSWRRAVALGCAGTAAVTSLPFLVATAVRLGHVHGALKLAASDATFSPPRPDPDAAPPSVLEGGRDEIAAWSALVQLKTYLQTCLRTASAIGPGVHAAAPSLPSASSAASSSSAAPQVLGWGWDVLPSLLMSALGCADRRLAAYQMSADPGEGEEAVPSPLQPPAHELHGQSAPVPTSVGGRSAFAALFDDISPPSPQVTARSAIPASSVTITAAVAAPVSKAEEVESDSWEWKTQEEAQPPAAASGAASVAAPSSSSAADVTDDDGEDAVEVSDPAALGLAAAGSLFSFARSALSTVAEHAANVARGDGDDEEGGKKGQLSARGGRSRAPSTASTSSLTAAAPQPPPPSSSAQPTTSSSSSRLLLGLGSGLLRSAASVVSSTLVPSSSSSTAGATATTEGDDLEAELLRAAGLAPKAPAAPVSMPQVPAPAPAPVARPSSSTAPASFSSSSAGLPPAADGWDDEWPDEEGETADSTIPASTSKPTVAAATPSPRASASAGSDVPAAVEQQEEDDAAAGWGSWDVDVDEKQEQVVPSTAEATSPAPTSAQSHRINDVSRFADASASATAATADASACTASTSDATIADGWDDWGEGTTTATSAGVVGAAAPEQPATGAIADDANDQLPSSSSSSALTAVPVEASSKAAPPVGAHADVSAAQADAMGAPVQSHAANAAEGWGDATLTDDAPEGWGVADENLVSDEPHATVTSAEAVAAGPPAPLPSEGPAQQASDTAGEVTREASSTHGTAPSAVDDLTLPPPPTVASPAPPADDDDESEVDTDVEGSAGGDDRGAAVDGLGANDVDDGVVAAGVEEMAAASAEVIEVSPPIASSSTAAAPDIIAESAGLSSPVGSTPVEAGSALPVTVSAPANVGPSADATVPVVVYTSEGAEPAAGGAALLAAVAMAAAAVPAPSELDGEGWGDGWEDEVTDKGVALEADQTTLSLTAPPQVQQPPPPQQPKHTVAETGVKPTESAAAGEGWGWEEEGEEQESDSDVNGNNTAISFSRKATSVPVAAAGTSSIGDHVEADNVADALAHNTESVPKAADSDVDVSALVPPSRLLMAAASSLFSWASSTAATAAAAALDLAVVQQQQQLPPIQTPASVSEHEPTSPSQPVPSSSVAALSPLAFSFGGSAGSSASASASSTGVDNVGAHPSITTGTQSSVPSAPAPTTAAAAVAAATNIFELDLNSLDLDLDLDLGVEALTSDIELSLQSQLGQEGLTVSSGGEAGASAEQPSRNTSAGASAASSLASVAMPPTSGDEAAADADGWAWDGDDDVSLDQPVSTGNATEPTAVQEVRSESSTASSDVAAAHSGPLGPPRAPANNSSNCDGRSVTLDAAAPADAEPVPASSAAWDLDLDLDLDLDINVEEVMAAAACAAAADSTGQLPPSTSAGYGSDDIPSHVAAAKPAVAASHSPASAAAAPSSASSTPAGTDRDAYGAQPPPPTGGDGGGNVDSSSGDDDFLSELLSAVESSFAGALQQA